MMGVTMDLGQLKHFLKKPALPLIGIAGKWTVLFGMSFLLAKFFFAHNAQLAGGVILTGAVPSGTSANLFSLIGGGNVALSVTMSALDTLAGPALTPVLAHWAIGPFVQFSLWPFVWQMIRVVFIPLITGGLFQLFGRRLSKGLKKVTPALSALALYIVVLGVVSKASSAFLVNKQILIPLILEVVLQVSIPMLAGYWYAKLWRMDEASCRSVLFEVGIPNAALAAVLAAANIGALAGLVAVLNMIGNLTFGAVAASLLLSHRRSWKRSSP